MHAPPASAAAAQRDHRHFRAIEQHLVGQASRHARLASARRRQRPFTAAFCEETIEVHARLRNPLDTPLHLANVRLACAARPRDAASDASTDAPPFVEVDKQGLRGLCERADASAAAARVKPVDVDIPAGGSVDVTFEVTPREEGWLRVEGLRWDVVVPPAAPPEPAAASSSPPPPARHDSQAGEAGSIGAACFWRPRQHRQRCDVLRCESALCTPLLLTEQR